MAYASWQPQAPRRAADAPLAARQEPSAHSITNALMGH